MNFYHEKLYERFVEALQGRELILFGSGHFAEELILSKFKHGEILEIWDNNPSKHGKYLYGYRICCPPQENDITGVDMDKFVVMIAIWDDIAVTSISKQLMKLGINHIFPFTVMTLSNELDRYDSSFSFRFHERNNYRIVHENEDKINKVVDLLEDDKSRFVYHKIVEKMKYSIGNYAEICDNVHDHYFSDGIFKYGDEEVFVDGGAFCGEDTIRLAEIIGKERIKRSYCFEPDSQNYERLINSLCDYFGEDERKINGNEYYAAKFVAYKAGIWDSNANVGFSGGGTQGGAIIDSNMKADDEMISTARIDDIILEQDKVTFIKMDVEGAEMRALSGAQRVIMRDKPKLAISIYHRIEDLWQIPLFIHELVPEYKFFIRHHTVSKWDSILYATM